MYHIFELYWLSQVVLSKQLGNDQFQQGTLICLGSYKTRQLQLATYRKLDVPLTKPRKQVFFRAAWMYAPKWKVVYGK